MIQLGDIGVFRSGGTPSRNRKEYWNGKYPWISSTALDSIHIDDKNASAWITEEGLQKSATKLIKENSIMVGIRVGVGKCSINTVPMCTSQDVVSVENIDAEKYDLPYLIALINSKRNYFERIKRGATIQGITTKVIKEIEVPDITKTEQQNIANTIKSINNLKKRYQQQPANLDTLVKSRFIEMFGDLKLNSRKWETIKLDHIANVGSSKRVFVEELVTDGVPFYRGTEIGALAEGKSIIPELFITKAHYKKLCDASGKPSKGDLLMPSICPDGRIWLVDTDESFYFKDGRVLWIHLRTDTFNNVFLQYVLKSIMATEYEHIASGTTFKELKIVILKSLDIPLVPRALQNKFADFVTQVESTKATVQKSLDKTQLLFDSLMQQYFG